MGQTFNLIWMQGLTCAGNQMATVNAKDPDFLGFLAEHNVNVVYMPTLSPEFGEDAQKINI